MSRESIAKALKRLRENQGMTADQVGAMIGKSGKTVNAWENNRGQPDAEMLMQLCKIYKVENILREFQDIPETINANPEYTTAEQQHIKKYRTLDAHGKDTVSIILDREYTRAGAAISQQKPSSAAEAQRATRIIDYYRLPVSAGTGTIDPGDGYHDTLEVLANRYTVASDYVVRVQGDSMKPRFLDGDLLLVHKTDVVDFGEIGVFSVDGKSFIKQAGCGELISLNRDYAPIPLTSAAVYPQGRIIGVLDPAWIVR